jgi:hypothetical protein
MPVIPAIWEVEIRRILVPGWPRQIIQKTPSQAIAGHSDAHLSPKATWQAEIKRILVVGSLVERVCETHLSGKKLCCGVSPVISVMAGSNIVGS